MKSIRKGFTLAELLIVIAVIGVLASMMMVSGSSAADTARATKIVEGFNSVSAAMLMYYTNNADECDAGTKTAADIKTGIADFLKDGGETVADTGTPVGKYAITIEDGTWWLTYTLADDDLRVGAILKDKAKSLGIKTAVNGTTDYDGKDTICMKVR